jgi:hypothetical protein
MPQKIDTWRSKPIENEIILNLIRNRGEMLSTDLYRNLSNLYQDFSMMDMMDFLFRLEVRMMINVIQIKRDVLKIEIAPKAPLSKDMDELIKKVHG